MLKKLLIIVGPTASGKTDLSLRLAKKYHGEIVSADSRQVYKGMDIGTGKDLVSGAKLKIVKSLKGFRNSLNGYYQIRGVKVWGYDLAKPKDDFNVSDYVTFASFVVNNIWERERLSIITGGSGFYISALLDGVSSLIIPPNLLLRKKLNGVDVGGLRRILEKSDAKFISRLNESDIKNPRRLIRAIEIAEYKRINPDWLRRNSSSMQKVLDYDKLLIVGLFAEKSALDERVSRRVNKRIEDGFEKEVLRLIKSGVDWRYKSMQAMGYLQFRDYNNGKSTREEFIRKWILEERKYVKRQLTWFKKDKRICWFDITSPRWIDDLEKRVQSWYHEE
ncbi:MAG: tRNA dimethylallyltransferase [Candidatus Woesebacteria bacterium GW2011_GWA1_39_21]|uniref:tRNA dimethylallyltransferase n=1 Tax=Candidatus Woesebacteria bacterium GW2011_GWA1_39_21 TaxID=1618550 RepID=A0A0G0N644_9BACT|nr:MAG: tRNA dimethylallyltransferase [Candidatus Woesebacteria bacterium GW2011_GWA1_39_21]